MTVQFDLKKEDLQALTEVHTRLPSARKPLTILLAVIMGLAYGIVFVVNFFRTNGHIDGMVWGMAAAGLAVLFIMFRFRMLRWIYKLMFPVVYRLRGGAKLLGHYTFDFTEDTVAIQSPLGEHQYRWEHFENIVLTDHYLFLYLTRTSAYIIPLFRTRLIHEQRSEWTEWLQKVSENELILLDKRKETSS